MHSVRRLLLAATVVAAAQAVPAPEAASATTLVPDDRLGIQLMDAPVSGKSDPRAHIYIVDQLKTGTTISRHVTLASPPVTRGIQQINRVGIRIYVDIAGNAQASDFSISTITATRDRSGQPRVTAQVHNTGGRAVDIAGTADLSDGPGGLRTDPTPTNAAVTIGPGDTQQVSANFDKRLTAGPWLVTVKLASGTLHRSASATVRFPAALGSPVVVPVVHTRHRSPWWVWVAGGGLALVLVLGVGAWALRRRSPSGTD